jgi:hypothetical protein
MRVAFGAKAHSGWAALVVVGRSEDDFVLLDRRRIELVEEEWAKQPYHAARELDDDRAREILARGIEMARRCAVREIRAATEREQDRRNPVEACAVLVTEPMPEWTVEEILAVHFRMHKAEGCLFRDSLVNAAEVCRLPVARIEEKDLAERTKELGATLARLGKSAGAPWGKDQKEAALAAILALSGKRGPRDPAP